MIAAKMMLVINDNGWWCGMTMMDDECWWWITMINETNDGRQHHSPLPVSKNCHFLKLAGAGRKGCIRRFLSTATLEDRESPETLWLTSFEQTTDQRNIKHITAQGKIWACSKLLTIKLFGFPPKIITCVLCWVPMGGLPEANPTSHLLGCHFHIARPIIAWLD